MLQQNSLVGFSDASSRHRGLRGNGTRRGVPREHEKDKIGATFIVIVDSMSRRSTVGMDGVGFTILLLRHDLGGDEGSASEMWTVIRFRFLSHSDGISSRGFRDFERKVYSFWLQRLAFHHTICSR